MHPTDRKAGSVGACGLMLAVALLAALPAPAHAEPTAAPPSPPDEASAGQLTSFFFGPSYQITPLPPVNESGGQVVDALGVSLPRALLSNVGTWSVTLTEEGMNIDSLESLSIWASSDQTAQNVHFTVNVALNGNSAGTLRTVTKDTLSSNPEEFPMDRGSSQITRSSFEKGQQLTFQLQYQASSSPLPVGPSADSVFHYYGNLYRSRVDLITSPFNLTLSKVVMDQDRINVTEIVKDAFGVDPLAKIYSLTFSGSVSSIDKYVHLVSSAIDPVNGTTLTWNWFFAAQGVASSGQYAVTIAARYVGSDINYSNTSSADLKFPKLKGGGKGFLPGLGGLEAVAAVAAVALAIGGVSRARGRPPRARP